jgi:5-formyltetrahydrofolate cyclo-ligase
MPDLGALRNRLRGARRALSGREQRAHSERVARLLSGSAVFQRARRIAVYLTDDGELDLGPVVARARSSGKRLFLPVLRPRPQRSLWLCEFRPGDPLRSNRFGIGEPDPRRRRPVVPWGLDLVLVPLVGFDEAGNRLGMGGGFYDRSFAYRRRRRCWHKPRLIGIAHECQKLRHITHRGWDVGLDGVVTERCFYRCVRRI